MSDFPLLTDELPKIVHVCRTEYNICALTTKDFGAEYLRADLAPTVGPLVEVLERIVEGFFGENERKIAREALAEWKGGLNE